MSDDKKRDRAVQRRVRERQAKTGESYQAAWQRLTADAALNPSNKHASSRGARRVPLPMGTNIKVLPGQSAQITARPQLDSFWPERFLIKNADHWDLHRLIVEKGNGSLLETEPRTATSFSLDTWRPLTEREVRCGESVVVTVTYTGPNKKGESFEATMFGWESGPAPSTDRNEAPASERISERAESPSVAAHETVQLPLVITHPALFVDRLTITNAKDWVVNDIKTRGKSIFVQSGDVPGEMFSESACVVLEPLTAEDRVTVIATYVGNDSSARLVVTLSGTSTSTNSPRAPRVCSYFLPMSTGVPILPEQSAQITGRPQSNFLPERLVIAEPDAWIINDIKVGIRSQLAACGEIPGQSFSSRTVGSHVTLDPVRKGQDFIVVTTRGDDCKNGAGFFCGVQGRVLQRSARERKASTDELVTATEIDDDVAGADARRLFLPLHLLRVPPHQPTRVAARTDSAVDIDGIHISNAGTIGGAADWVVNDIEIDGRSQLTHKDLPGVLFGGSIAAAKRAKAALSLEGFDPVERNRELALIVTYVGQNPEGVPFFASAVGSKPQQRPTIVPIASKYPLLPTAKTTITARVSTPFQMARLEIDNGATQGGAADWIVGDLRINGKSQFVQSGDVPGDLFACSAIDTFVKLEACEAGNTIELDMIYIGLNEHGAIFAARLEGTVLRDDYSVPPPDLHVVVETSGQGPGEVVIATCNWRAPATDNRTR